MGSFYTNVTLTGVEGVRALDWLRSRGQPCFVEVSERGAVVLDAAGEAQDGLHVALAAQLSAALGCTAIAALNHDDDILRITVFVDGLPTDSYDSSPDYFDSQAPEGPPVGGENLASLFARDEAEVERVLRSDFEFEHERHSALIEVLGLPTAACGFGFDYVCHGDQPAPSTVGAVMIELP